VRPTTAAPGRTRTTHDGAGRVTAQIFDVNEVERWRTTTTYGGDRVNVDPPDGAPATTTVANARGRTTELRQYTGGAPTGTYQATTYGYDHAGRLASVTDPAGNAWTYTHDLRGRQVGSTGPDKGQVTFAFDDAGQPSSSSAPCGARTAGRRPAPELDQILRVRAMVR
jgi:YD repeat-containing protein